MLVGCGEELKGYRTVGCSGGSYLILCDYSLMVLGDKNNISIPHIYVLNHFRSHDNVAAGFPLDRSAYQIEVERRDQSHRAVWGQRREEGWSPTKYDSP